MKRIIIIIAIISFIIVGFSLTPIELTFKTENGSVKTLYFLEYFELFDDLERDEPVHSAELVKYVDGDTINVRMFSFFIEKIRMLGIDTPETVHPSKPVEYYGPQASEFVKKVIPFEEKILKLSYDWDKFDYYERLLAYIWIPVDFMGQKEYVLFNLLSILNGYGYAYLKYDFKDEYMEIFAEAQDYSKKYKLGLWGERPIYEVLEEILPEKIIRSAGI